MKMCRNRTCIRNLFKAIIVIAFLTLMACGHAPIHIPTPNQLPVARPLKDIRIALVLGGGGARGAAHAGVLSVLEEHHISIDLIVGTSIGSVVGALYADKPDSDLLKQKILKLNKWEVLDPNFQTSIKMLWTLSGIVEGYALKRYLKNNLSTHDFSQLAIPLAVVSTDIELGEVFVIRSGPIVPAIHASSAIPLVFQPVKLYGKVLVDGGVISPVPVEIARELGAKYVIAVDIGNVIEPMTIKGSYQLADRCMWLSYSALSHWQNQQADILIQPKFKLVSMFDDNSIEEYYQLGRIAAQNVLPELLALLN